MMNQALPLTQMNNPPNVAMGPIPALMGNGSFHGNGGADNNGMNHLAFSSSSSLATALINQGNGVGASVLPNGLTSTSTQLMGLTDPKAFQQLLQFPSNAMTTPVLPSSTGFQFNGMDSLKSTYLLQKQLMMKCNAMNSSPAHLLAAPSGLNNSTIFPGTSVTDKTLTPQNPLMKRDNGPRKRGGVLEPFPEKLHRMLREVEAAGRSDVISFVAGGRAFAIHKPNVFFNEIVPYYFRQSRLSSFKRQLNLYGFELINSGPSRGGYFHDMFRRDMPEMCLRMRRTVNQKQKTNDSVNKDAKAADSPFLDEATGVNES